MQAPVVFGWHTSGGQHQLPGFGGSILSAAACTGALPNAWGIASASVRGFAQAAVAVRPRVQAYCGEHRGYGKQFVAAWPNPLLNRTRYGYGMPAWPGLGYTVHSPSPGQAVLPQRAG